MDLKQLTTRKDEGNDLFKLKKYDESIAKFQSCITQIESSQSRDFLSKETQISKLYVVCLINAALACINTQKLQRYDTAVQCCSKALAIDTENIKAIYRRGVGRKEKAEIIEREKGVKAEGLLELYQKSVEDFQKLCNIDKNNDLAKKHLKLAINDIYRVKVGRGQNAFKSDTNTSNNKDKNHQQKAVQIEQHSEKPRKKGTDMNKIMKDYKVDEVTAVVQEKVRSQYLTQELPPLKSQFEKAIRTLQKSEDTYVQFVYRLNESYLAKINPTFDLLSGLVSILVKKGSGDQAKLAFQAIHKQKGFKLLWKSYSSAEKDSFKAKWKEVGLSEDVL